MHPAHYRMNWLPVGKLLDVEKSCLLHPHGHSREERQCPWKTQKIGVVKVSPFSFSIHSPLKEVIYCLKKRSREIISKTSSIWHRNAT